MRKYIPIKIESLSKSGKWEVRNALTAENSSVQGGEMTRAELVARAQKWMSQWVTNYDHAATLRVSGLPKSYFSREMKDV